MNIFNKVWLVVIIASMFVFAGCMKEKEVSEEQINVENGNVENFMAEELSKINMSGVELLVEAGLGNKRGEKLFIVDYYQQNNAIKRGTEGITEESYEGRGYNETVVISDKSTRIDYELKEAAIRYTLTYVGDSNTVEFDGDITVAYKWNGNKWEKNTVEVEKNEVPVLTEDDKRANGFPEPFYRTLSYNSSSYMRGNDVKRMQELLDIFFKKRNMTYTMAPYDGVFGPNTRGGVIKFQQCWRELTADGIFGIKTAEILIAQTVGSPTTGGTVGTGSATGNITVSTMTYTTLPLSTNTSETLSVRFVDTVNTSANRSYYTEVYAVRDNGEFVIASGNVTIASGKTENTVNYSGIKFNTSGTFYTLVKVYKSSTDKTLVTQRKGGSPDTISGGESLSAGYNYKIKVELPSDRNREGNLYLYNKNLAHLHTTRALGRSVSGDSVFVRNGNTPTGDYSGILQDRMGGATISYGYGNIVAMTGIAGDAKTAYSYGRDGIWIHGGRWDYNGSSTQRLSATYGCVRIPNPDQDKMFGTSSSSRGLLGANGVAWKSKGYITVRTY